MLLLFFSLSVHVSSLLRSLIITYTNFTSAQSYSGSVFWMSLFREVIFSSRLYIKCNAHWAVSCKILVKNVRVTCMLLQCYIRLPWRIFSSKTGNFKLKCSNGFWPKKKKRKIRQKERENTIWPQQAKQFKSSKTGMGNYTTVSTTASHSNDIDTVHNV